MTHETGHFYLIAPEMPFFTARRKTMCKPWRKYLDRRKTANIADVKYYKNGNF